MVPRLGIRNRSLSYILQGFESFLDGIESFSNFAPIRKHRPEGIAADKAKLAGDAKMLRRDRLAVAHDIRRATRKFKRSIAAQSRRV